MLFGENNREKAKMACPQKIFHHFDERKVESLAIETLKKRWHEHCIQYKIDCEKKLKKEKVFERGMRSTLNGSEDVKKSMLILYKT